MMHTHAWRTCGRAVGGARRGIKIEKRIAELGYTLPPNPPEPRGSYMTYLRHGNMVYLSGHLPQAVDGTLTKGRLGENLTVEEGQAAARLASLQMMASLKHACGDLDKVKKVIKLVGFVSSTNDFTSQATVMNGCSELFGEVFGLEIGRHSRSALGVNVLPLGIAVEIEGIVEVED
ncbi:putative endoribonuclease L-PSP [Ochromonadaceae sp. CCMP2298]|nr:putative endoribonuclease L-PSP [Ochromonadaceae sp. CCMP2298]